MFERILVCLDGSKLAEQIIPYATEQALQFDSKVTLLQVMSIPSSIAMASVAGALPQTGDVIEADVQRQEAEIKACLDGVAQYLLEKGIDTECVTLGPSQPGETIVKYAQDNSFDLICIATHGHSGLGRVVFGSVADYVLRKSGLPILVIKPREIEA
ncbi:MAG TPA: universal stress protein [Chloroflexi bacterium]|nr:universal stress protein [Chloroflexota bacterium]